MSPVRISFAGGGTDMPEYYNEYGGAVISANISKFTYVILNPRQDNLFQSFSSDLQQHHEITSYDNLEPKHGSEIAVAVVKYLKYTKGANFIISSDVQPGSGLGASSSLCVNFIKTISSLQGDSFNPSEIAEKAFNLERNILHHSIGMQDPYATAFGGFNYITFKENEIKVNPIKINNSTLSELEENLLLFFVGNSGRDNKIILSNHIDRIKNQEKNLLNSLHDVKFLAEEFYRSLTHSDISSVGELLNKGWEAKKKFANGISNNYIDKIYESAIKAGAIGGKLTGAGGGGHMLLYCEKRNRKKVIQKLNKLGLRHIPFTFHSEGPKVLNLYDYVK